jgi:hypothetical protein
LSIKSPAGCFFLDSNILIPEILTQNNVRIWKLKRDATSHNIPCYFSDSVKIETERKVRDTTDFIGSTIKDTLVMQLEDSRRKRRISLSDPLTIQDIKALEDLFYGFHGAARAQRTLTDPLSLIEEWVISFLAEKLDKGISITIPDLGRELVKSVLKLTVNIQDSYDNLVTFEKGFVKKKGIPADPRMVKTVANLELLGIHAPDSDHVASAVMNQILSSEKTVFVSLDFSTILNKRDIIRINFRLECCDPLYAFHHLS